MGMLKNYTCPNIILLSFKWNLIRLGGHAHEIVTKTVHKTLPGGGRVVGMGMGVWGSRLVGSRGWWSLGGGGVKGVVGSRGSGVKGWWRFGGWWVGGRSRVVGVKG